MFNLIDMRIRIAMRRLAQPRGNVLTPLNLRRQGRATLSGWTPSENTLRLTTPPHNLRIKLTLLILSLCCHFASLRVNSAYLVVILIHQLLYL